jgi:hypothetical protein
MDQIANRPNLPDKNPNAHQNQEDGQCLQCTNCCPLDVAVNRFQKCHQWWDTTFNPAINASAWIFQ